MISLRLRTALPVSVLFAAMGGSTLSLAAPSGDEARATPDKDAAAPQTGSPPAEEVLPESEAGRGSATAPAALDSANSPPSSTILGPVDLTVTTSHMLKNDLEVVLQATPGAPEVSVCTAIDAGSRLDPVTSPGAYRVLAEILKDGGYRSAAQDYVALVLERGGSSEVKVTREATTFCTTVPAGELELALWVTAGRFTSGALTESALAEAVDRLAKESEFLDSQVRTGRAPERLRRMAFLGTYAYAHPTLPNPDDLDSISLDTIRKLHRESYVTRRAKVAISGGFELDDGVSQLPKHLYAARVGEVFSYQLPKLVNQTTARFSMAEDRTAKTPAAWYGWVAPADHRRVPMEIALSTLVSDSRLAKQLVGPGRAAKSIHLSLDDESSHGSYGLVRLEIVGSSSQSLGTIEKGFDDQLKNLTKGILTADEVMETQRRLLRERAEELATPLGRARALSQGVLFGKASSEILLPLAGDAPLPEISVEDVKAAALELLDSRRRAAIEIYPKGWQDPWQEPMRKYHIVSKGETLGSIASRYGTTVAFITQLNKMKQSQTIYPGDKLRVPRSRGAPAEKKMRTHQVRRGDTVSGLARKYGVSVREIADANGMGAKLTIRTGETLQIPWAGSTSSSGGKSSSAGSSSDGSSKDGSGDGSSSYKVQSGDTLSEIAAKHGVSTVALARANGVSHKAMVKVGQTLNVPPRGSGKGPVLEPIIYTVKKGDTLSGIAAKHGVTVAAVTVENQMSRDATLRPGQKLKIPKK